MKRSFFLLLLLLPSFLIAQLSNSDTTRYKNNKYLKTEKGISFSAKQLIVPATLITIGTIGMIERDFDWKIKNKYLQIQGNTYIDNFLPFVAPGAAYVLNWSSIQGKHNFIDRTMILGTSTLITSVLVYSSKFSIDRKRPDEDGSDSFPSMHTAVAFMGAEFLRQEYGDRSIWYGITGYTLAAGTGLLRMYNNRHWLSDVLTGAGVGILATKIAYWVYPEIRKLYSGSKLNEFQFMLFFSSTNSGINFTMKF
jgi:Membrane-associated phospholipid phosphatase